MENITFITGNTAKAEQLAFHLKAPIAHKKLDLVEIQSLDLEEVVRDKAERAYAIMQSPVLVEDTSLRFSALGRLPGPLIKWFLTDLGNDGLAHLVDGKDRTATAEVMFGLHDGTTCHIFTGSKKGRIAEIPRGEKGFGWDPVFIPEGHDKTWAEMTLEEQSETSMRRIALAKLQEFLA
ncbi:MAG: non-canonical purine NTP pyrophosphatase [bacterium]